MDRRSFLGSAAVGAAGMLAGCLSAGVTVTSAETSYPSAAGAVYQLRSELTDESQESSVSFESLSREQRLEVANAIHRGEYLLAESPAISADDVSSVDYRDQTFTVSYGISDGIGYGQNPDTLDFVTFDATATGTELECSMTNSHSAPLEVFHTGRPYFGVGVAVGETVTLLAHDRYVENDTIEIYPITRQPPHPPRERTATIEPGDSLTESYIIGDSVPGDAVVYVSTLIRNDALGIGEFPTGRFSLETD
ncbi:twin-arginine translocation signal domain-containing protein [Natronolimnobius baerhuensis]|uniref:Uncharacterized protein n=1 Tax=Natronolimnobius baerhuensis TaxID=253108 RepID=A0A202E8J1_9EURY|nr:twin-arginine translocation signal domain-containing protein [Natronolimnobius baerhuensis]OVE84458.1 hypothetical protein B2G88_08595 [Natronolimnobius baerhuensis]